MEENSAYIKRLKERLAENPYSKLFLSLAEEYKRLDKIHSAIHILIEGINKNPDYIAARLRLGKYYVECDMLSEAKKEFLEVIKRFPANISAHKNLAEINKRLGPDREVLSKKEASLKRLHKFLEVIKKHFTLSTENRLLS